MSILYHQSNGIPIRLAYAGGGYRSHAYSICEIEKEQLQQKYNTFVKSTNNILLLLNKDGFNTFMDSEAVEQFLYGASVKTLSTSIGKERLSPGGREYDLFPEVKIWDKELVHNIDWQKFMSTFYVFVFSETSFEFKMWEYIKEILLLIANDSAVLHRVIKNAQDDNDEQQIQEFWNSICYLLKEKIMNWCSNECCWLAFMGIKEAAPIFDLCNNIDFYEIEKYFCSIVDHIALERLLNYDLSIDNIFGINGVFFYDEYSELTAIDENIRKQICDIIMAMGDSCKSEYLIVHCYNLAQKYAIKEQKEILDLKMKPYRKKESVKIFNSKPRTYQLKGKHAEIVKAIGRFSVGVTLFSVALLLVWIILFVISLMGSFESLNNFSLTGGIWTLAVAGISFGIALTSSWIAGD